LKGAEAADLPTRCLPADLKTALVWIKNPLDRAVMERQLDLLGVKARLLDGGVAAQAKQGPMTRFISVAEEPGQVAAVPKPFTRTMLFDALLTAAHAPPPNALDRPVRVLAAEDNSTNQLVLRSGVSRADP